MYNLVMSTQDFSLCDDYEDSLKTLYRALYPNLERLMNENIKLRNLVAKSDQSLHPDFVQISGTEPDINKLAKRLLEQGREEYLAKKRMNIIDPKGVTPIK